MDGTKDTVAISVSPSHPVSAKADAFRLQNRFIASVTAFNNLAPVAASSFFSSMSESEKTKKTIMLSEITVIVSVLVLSEIINQQDPIRKFILLPIHPKTIKPLV